MQIRKIYNQINPELLYNEVKDFALNLGMTLHNEKLENYSIANDSSSFITRGTLTFMTKPEEGKSNPEYLHIHILGTAKDQTKLMLDANESVLTKDKISELQSSLDFIFSTYEI